VQGGEALVGVRADEAVGDAGFVEPDGRFGVAASFRSLGLEVAFEGDLKAA